MPRKLAISALGTSVWIDLEGLSDEDARAVQDAWRDAVVVERADPPLVVERADPPLVAERADSPLVVERAESPLVVERADSPLVVERADSPLVVERAERDETPPPPAERTPHWSLSERSETKRTPTVTPLSSADRRTMLADLSQRVTLAAIEARRGDVWMLHAAGVALPDGRVVALVGPSGRGKTTASRVLGQTLGYVSDETVAIDDDGRVWPYRKPLSISEGAGHKAQRAPSDAGLRPLPDAELRLAAVVLLDRRDDGPDDPLVEPVDLGDALEELVAQSSYLSDMPAPLQTMATLVASAGGVRRVTYQDASTLAATLPQLVSYWSLSEERSDETKRPAPAPHATVSPWSLSEERSDETKRADHPLWFRTPVHDELALDDPDRIALLQTDTAGHGTVRVLAGVAPALWRAADAASVDDLVIAAVAAHGEPQDADAETLIRAALADLEAAGPLEERLPRWGVRRDVAWTGEGDRFVALALSDPTASPRALEGSAAAIWSALAAGDAETAVIVQRVAEGVGVEPEVVAADVEAFLTTLRDEALTELR